MWDLRRRKWGETSLEREDGLWVLGVKGVFALEAADLLASERQAHQDFSPL